MKKDYFDITGMTCSACSARIEKNVSKLDGMKTVSVNLLKNSMTVEYDDQMLTVADIVGRVEKTGYGAFLHNASTTTLNNKPKEDIAVKEFQEMKKRLWISILFSVPLFYISMGHMFNWPLPEFLLGIPNAMNFAFTQFLLLLPVMYVNRKYFKVGFKTLFQGAPNMDSLIALGSIAAAVYGVYAIYKIGMGLGMQDMSMVHTFMMDLYFESAGMILTLITFGKFLEARAKGQTSEAISKLIDLAPKTALKSINGKEVEIPIEDVTSGDVLIVKAGTSIPVDGVVINGTGSVDESALTGESIPVEKNTGDNVIGATINKSGYFTMEALKVGEDTTLSQIVKLVDEATSSKAPIAKLADKVSGIFVPIVIVVALIATITWLVLGKDFEFALSIGISILVISCPCALGLATPTAIMVGTGKGAENGILIKSAEALETAHNISTVVLDKTGTVTEGKPIVTDIITHKDITENEFLHIVHSLEKLSEHPLAEAIIHQAESKQITFEPVEDFIQLQGEGICGLINDILYYAGNAKMLKKYLHVENALLSKGERFAMEGKTPLYVFSEDEVLGVVAIADTVKKTSKQAVTALKELGVDVVMLTGDNAKTAEAIRKQVNIDHVVSEVLPQDKERVIREYQGKGNIVAMVGDGINDAPALARADVGIAIGAGTDIAIESADVVLMKSDLLDVVTAIRLSKSVIRNIKQNLFWAFIYNAIGIPIAAGLFYITWGLKLNPMIGAGAMSLSSVCVVTNALRLKFFKIK
ncbi:MULTISPECIES: heavy metal translocating P-type ATPase [Bacillota]|uniref:heavy metal translocating P-type ATPase n=1 Tax=Bacillota TaxID=1239 RepID=UPI00097FEFF6|nr:MULTISPECIES: heavy metal translocating P-type ATPase [Bacillota]SJW36867.1 heavy metal translocating P-type ATPase [Clostridioides difficile]HBE9803912.1 copper-translocating P-type ATPase [Clostridioides difficile]